MTYRFLRLARIVADSISMEFNSSIVPSSSVSMFHGLDADTDALGAGDDATGADGQSMASWSRMGKLAGGRSAAASKSSESISSSDSTTHPPVGISKSHVSLYALTSPTSGTADFFAVSTFPNQSSCSILFASKTFLDFAIS